METEEGAILDEICMIYIHRMLRLTADAPLPSIEAIKAHDKNINDLAYRAIQLLEAKTRRNEDKAYWLYVGKLEGAACVIKLLYKNQNWTDDD